MKETKLKNGWWYKDKRLGKCGPFRTREELRKFKRDVKAGVIPF